MKRFAALIFGLMIGLAACSRTAQKHEGDTRKLPESAKMRSPSHIQGEVSAATSAGTMGRAVGTDNADAKGAPPLDVSGYGFAQKTQFKEMMRERLQKVDRGIVEMKSNKSRDSAQTDPQLQRLTSERNQVDARLSQVDSVPQSQWVQFRNSFRNDVETLERTYAQSASTH